MPLLEPGTDVGRYTILGRLATGGMSEIYLARQSGPSGFSKVVVLKVILPHLAADATFMRMFTNEARLAAVLNHPNVVQIFDYGEEHGRLYMAMEYIDGRNLNRINKVLRERGERVPLRIALRIISDTCGALEYAHSLCDAEGNELQIIHRDISRENILVTYRGQIKLVDFGVAKATFLESYTTEGTLKGKYAYMAPEVVSGEDPNRQVDIYALGVTLYAVLLSQLPYQGKHHAQILEQILYKDPPRPRELDLEVPGQVEAIILKAMHKDKEQRYQRAAELQHDLEDYLMGNEPAVMPYHLSQFMAKVFPPGSDTDRETYQSLTGATPPSGRSTPSKPRLDPTGPFSPEPPSPDQTEPPGPSSDQPGFASDETVEDHGHIPSAEENLDDILPPISSNRGLIGIIIALVLLTGVGIALYLLFARTPDPIAGVTPDDPDAAVAESAPDGSTVAVAADGTVVVLGTPPDSRVAVKPDARRPDSAAQTRPVAKTHRPPIRRPVVRRKVGTITLQAPGPGEVSLGRRRLGKLPLGKTTVPAGTHRIVVRSRKLGYRMVREIPVAPGTHQDLRFKPKQGTILVLIHPWAKVTLDGKLLGITPLKPIKALEGPHLLVLENSELKIKRKKWVQVKPGQATKVKLVLE